MRGRSRKVRDRHTVGVERRGDTRVAKFFGGDVLIEFEKALAMEAALAGTPFKTPRAVHCHADTGYIEYEFLNGMVLLQEVIERAYYSGEYRRAARLNSEAAKLLGTLHQKLVVPEHRNWQPPPFMLEHASRSGFAADADDVFLHCDYSPVNLLVDPEGRLAVIDPSPNNYFTHYASLKGRRLVDVATYTAKLLWPFRVRSYSPAWRKLAGRLRERFIRVYEKSSGGSLDRQLLGEFEYAVTRCFIEWKTEFAPLRWSAIKLAKLARRHQGFN